MKPGDVVIDCAHRTDGAGIVQKIHADDRALVAWPASPDRAAASPYFQPGGELRWYCLQVGWQSNVPLARLEPAGAEQPDLFT